MYKVSRGSRQPLFPLVAHILGIAHISQRFPGKSWLHSVWLRDKAIFRDANKQLKIHF